uniref:Ribosome biogenesis protein BRX1 homolog n=1 Tax=Culicoides sonorensis TaxID=179676 RepID=A0A336MA96_CULSO
MGKLTKKEIRKGAKKRKNDNSEKEVKEILPPAKIIRQDSDADVYVKKSKWKNKRRVLVLCARGISYRDRHLLRDIKTLMPHHKAEPKMERWKTFSVIKEMAEMKHCDKALLFEGRHKRDLYMWLSSIPDGPSVKFLIESLSTMGELRLVGNCLRGSRPLLSFNEEFNKEPFLKVIKELLTQVFGVPNHHPKSQPFIDRVYTFVYLDKRIWFRHYQILSEDGALSEIGPRFVMNPVKIFEDSFSGQTLWENPDYVSPARYRQQLRKNAKYRYMNRTEQKVAHEVTKPKTSYHLDPFNDIFEGEKLASKAKELLKKEIKQENGNAEVINHGFVEEDE